MEAIEDLGRTYLGIGAVFFCVKLSSALVFMVLGSVGRQGAVAVLHAFISVLTWPRYLYILLSRGFIAFWRTIFYLWYL